MFSVQYSIIPLPNKQIIIKIRQFITSSMCSPVEKGHWKNSWLDLSQKGRSYNQKHNPQNFPLSVKSHKN